MRNKWQTEQRHASKETKKTEYQQEVGQRQGERHHHRQTTAARYRIWDVRYWSDQRKHSGVIRRCVSRTSANISGGVCGGWVGGRGTCCSEALPTWRGGGTLGRAVGVWLLQEVTVEAALTWSTQRHTAHTNDGRSMGVGVGGHQTTPQHFGRQGSNYRNNNSPKKESLYIKNKYFALGLPTINTFIINNSWNGISMWFKPWREWKSNQWNDYSTTGNCNEHFTRWLVCLQ